MKVIFLAPRNDLSGCRKLISMLSNELCAKHEVKIFYPAFPDFALLRGMRTPPRWGGYIKKCLIDLKAVLMSPRWRYKDLLEEKVTVKRYWASHIPTSLFEGADVAIYFTAYQALELAQMKSRVKHFVYYVMHDQSVTDTHFFDPAVIRDTYRNSDRKIALSVKTAKVLQSMGVHAEAIIPGGIAPSVFHSKGRQPSERLSILAYYWPGEPRKGASELLEVLCSIRRQYPLLKISLLAPPGLRTSEFETFANLSEDELAEVYRAHSVFVFPSAHEGFGLPPLEAMACGCAVIAMRVGAVEEYAQHGNSAWLCDPGKPDQIVEAIKAFQESPQLVARLAANAVKASQVWTWRSAGIKLDAYLSSLEGSGRCPASSV